VPNPIETLREDAAAIYDAALRGVEPGRAVLRALQSLPVPDRVSVVAIGKASAAMVGAALEHLARSGRAPRNGIMVTPDRGPAPHPAIVRIAGDHPLPADRSAEAARMIEAWTAGVEPGETIWAFLSGGASSLVGAPVDSVTAADYSALQQALFGAGLPIDRLNQVRKRVSRLGGGRLAARLEAAVAVDGFLLSDVPSDAPADIGSGPLEPDDTTAGEVRALLVGAIGSDRIPRTVRAYLDRVERGELGETPKPGDPAFARRRNHLVGSNRIALEHAAARAGELGYAVTMVDHLLTGDAAAAGRIAGDRIVADSSDRPQAWIAGGETTVVLGADAGRGGRCQELGLAAAERLAGTGLVLLAAGTDGRDGPTDAAGAVVDGNTWSAIRAAGIDPAAALRRHDAYPALERVGALLRTGPTGTNVMDVMIALGRPG
jgi:glycerate-2-kinase